MGEKRVFTGLAAINAMPSDEFRKRLMTEAGFGAKVDKLENAKRRGK